MLAGLYKANYGKVQKAGGGKLGIDPLNVIQGGHKSLVKKMESLPAPSQRAASQEAHNAAYLKEAANNLDKIVKARQEQIASVVKMQGLAAKHQGNVMNASSAMAEIEKSFRMQFAQHGAKVEKAQAELDGYMAALEDNRRGLYA